MKKNLYKKVVKLIQKKIEVKFRDTLNFYLSNIYSFYLVDQFFYMIQIIT